MCDFIAAAAAMADSVRDFYLGWHATRRWIYEIDLYLDHADLEFADAVTLTLLAGQVGEIRESRHAPGDTSRMDTVGLTIVG